MAELHSQLARWGDAISEERKDELLALLQASRGDEQGPLAGIELTGADVFWLAAKVLSGSQGDIAGSEEQLRAARHDYYIPYLVDLRTLRLDGADLRGAILDHAILRYANLRMADLRDAQLDDANLEGADLDETLLERAHLSRANLNSAHLEYSSIAGAILTCARLQSAHLRGADLSGTNLERADLRNANLERASLNNAVLRSADLRGVRLHGATLHDAKLEQAKMEKADLTDASLVGAHVIHAQLREAHLEGSNFRKAYLTGSDLSQALLTGARLEKADLQGVNLKEAVLHGARLNESVLHGSDLRGADLADVGLEGVILADKRGIGPHLVDVRWGNASLALIRWDTVRRLGDEVEANRKRLGGGARKTYQRRSIEFQMAARACRQLSVALRSQGLSTPATRFHYHAEVSERKASFFQALATISLALRRIFSRWVVTVPGLLVLAILLFIRWALSLALGTLSGYGDYISRLFLSYGVVVSLFAVAYLADVGGALSVISIGDAVILSITAFHGRGLASAVGVDEFTRALAAIEGVVGLLIEGLFVATFTRRVMGS